MFSSPYIHICIYSVDQPATQEAYSIFYGFGWKNLNQNGIGKLGNEKQTGTPLFNFVQQSISLVKLVFASAVLLTLRTPSVDWQDNGTSGNHLLVPTAVCNKAFGVIVAAAAAAAAATAIHWVTGPFFSSGQIPTENYIILVLLAYSWSRKTFMYSHIDTHTSILNLTQYLPKKKKTRTSLREHETGLVPKLDWAPADGPVRSTRIVFSIATVLAEGWPGVPATKICSAGVFRYRCSYWCRRKKDEGLKHGFTDG